MFVKNWVKWGQMIQFNIFTGRFYRFDKVFITILLIWAIEWALVFEYLFSEWWRSSIFLPNRVPSLLIICVGYWFFTWGISVWRRTQYGRFARGDRKLWAKALAAFWVAEFVTIGSIIIAYCWMNWGPLPLVPRRLMIPRRGMIFEFVIYSYIIFLAYMMKFSLNWCTWRGQLIWGFVVFGIFSLLLWRDALCLLFRDPMDKIFGARWRNVRLSALIYSLSHEWWIGHMLGRRGSGSYFCDLEWAFQNKTHPLNIITLTSEYEGRHWLTGKDLTVRQFRLTGNLFSTTITHGWEHFDLQNSGYYYPRRIGFLPKRLAMWQFLTFLKIFHHLVIMIWWLLFIYRNMARKQTSYNFLGSCYFNVYCCYLMGLMIYFIYFALFWETAFKLKPELLSFYRFYHRSMSCWRHIFRGIIWSLGQGRYRESLMMGVGVYVILGITVLAVQF
jgi:hypothetical protein